MKVSLVFEAPYNVMKDLVSERRFTSPQRQCSVDAFRNAIGKLVAYLLFFLNERG